jgi:hypothetical protein
MHQERTKAAHQFGTPNRIINTEEDAILATVDRAMQATPNAQVIGRNGELPLLNFFKRYLPYTLRAETGFFVTPRGELSPQTDLLILDARYPLLAENDDHSVRAMLHSVMWTVETKTTFRSRDFAGMWAKAGRVMQLAEQIKGYGLASEPVSIRTSAFAYRAAQSADATIRAFTKAAEPEHASLHAYVMRLREDDGKRRGVELEFDTNFPRGSKNQLPWYPVRRFTHTPLSDLYYDVVQWSYFILEHRDFSFGDIGQQMSEYMSWATDGTPKALK